MVWKRLLGKEAVVLQDVEFRFLLLSNAIVATVNAAVSPILDTLTGPFGVSPTEIGLMISVVFVPAVLLIPVSGIVAGRTGTKPVLIASLLLFGTAGMAIAFTTEFWLVLVFRFLQGIGFAGTIPVIIAALGELYEDEKQTASQGFRFAVSGGAQGLFPILSGILVIVAWQAPFFLFALALPIALLMAFRYEETARSSNQDKETETKNKKPEADVDAASIRFDSMDAYLPTLLTALREPKVGLVIVAHALVMVSYISFITYNSIIVIRSIGGTSSHAAILVTTVSFLYAASATQAGRIARIFSGRYLPLSAACLGTGVGLVTFASAPSIIVAMLGIALLGCTYGITGSLFRSLIIDVSPLSLREGIVGCSESILMSSAVLTPVVVGFAVGLLEPDLGTVTALQLILTVTGLSAATVACLCVLGARRSAAIALPRLSE
ncbi:MFS transporter [Halalkalicoccus salilacus]|uniref:MFS transporter n=1 Tax=Halalkalicoccus salilacus TaxID=3117459 RepID=UPI00300E8603